MLDLPCWGCHMTFIAASACLLLVRCTFSPWRSVYLAPNNASGRGILFEGNTMVYGYKCMSIHTLQYQHTSMMFRQGPPAFTGSEIMHTL